MDALQKAVDDAGAKVKDLKAGGNCDKEAIDAAVKDLLGAKEALKAAVEAAIAAGPDAATLEALQAKLATLTPKPDKKDKKKAAKEGGDAAAKAEAHKKAQEELKAAARAKKKAAAAEGGDGGKKKGGDKPAAAAAAAAPAAPAAAAKPAPASTTKKAALNKNTELYFDKAAPPLVALLVGRMAKIELVLKRVEPSQLPGGDAELVLPLGGGRLSGEHVIARYLARAAAPAITCLLYTSPSPRDS